MKYIIKKKNDDVLIHHGVLGMKWGVRRYQDINGRLTEKGKARFEKVSKSDFLRKRDQKTAIKIVKKNNFEYNPDTNIKYYTKKKEKELQKENPDTIKIKRYDENITYFKILKDTYNKKLTDFKSDTVKAGRDFIIQRDWDFYPGVAVKTSQIIYKK